MNSPSLNIRPGAWCWIGLAGYVVIADGLLIKRKRDTMSAVFGDTLSHPLKRLPVTVAWGVLTLHLFKAVMPRQMEPLKRYDPIAKLATMVSTN